MIIECGECNSKFNLDENLIKEDGSKVRCSVCNNVFMAYPPVPAIMEEPSPDESLDEDLEETVALDSPPVFKEKEPEPELEEMEIDFEKAFEEAFDKEDVQAISPDEIPDLEEEDDIDFAETLDRKPAVEEEAEKEEVDEEVPKKPKVAVETVIAPPVEKKPRRRSRVGLIVLVIIILLLGGGFAVYYFAPDLLPDSLPFLKPTKKEAINETGVRRLSLKSVGGYFIESGKAGQLFVIKGTVTNHNPRSRSFILIKGSLLNDKGTVVRSKMAYAGNTFKEKQIKEMPLEEINKSLKNRFGKERINVNVKPQSTIPFMMIFENLPQNMSEFTVEAVSSSPGA
jgi:predicted Zn finger-like uncharacterized protein